MKQLSLFDYGKLPATERAFVQRRAGEIRTLVRNSAENVVKVGEKLFEVKAKLGGQQFDAWVETEFNISRRTAYNFILTYRRFENQDFSQLQISVSALYLLSARSTPPEVRQKLLDRAQDGEPISYTTAKKAKTESAPKAKRRKATINERLTICECCGWPISTRAHLLPVSEFGENEYTMLLCRNCHDLYDLMGAVLDFGEWSTTTQTGELVNAVREELGETDPVYAFLDDKARKMHQVKIVLRRERNARRPATQPL